ncbi:hypothetical protein [Phyllobacterium bourgognense]|uniref:hypothetical protein n=1 Tax=Phyllobacterium bourgognense TaxID=314236 RepID=UPI0015F12233|nr:hypothetical protein [Phyllobacterium bourgognense]
MSESIGLAFRNWRSAMKHAGTARAFGTVEHKEIVETRIGMPVPADGRKSFTTRAPPH